MRVAVPAAPFSSPAAVAAAVVAAGAGTCAVCLPLSLPKIPTHVLPSGVGPSCQHGSVLLAEIVTVSQAVSATPSRNAKAALLADVLTRAATEPPTAARDGEGVDEIALVVRYLSGSLRQRRTGIELTHLTTLAAPAAASSVTVREVDACLQRAAELSGPGSSAARAAVFDGLLARLTADEQRFLTSLLRGGLRQGASESAVLTALASTAGAPAEDVRRAVTVSGSLPGVAAAVLRQGPAALAGFTLTVGQGVSPMLAGSAPSVHEALARTGPGGVEWKLDGIRAQIHKDGPRITVLTRSLDDITDRVPEVVETVARFGVASAILDGELIALNGDGRPRPFQQTGSRTASRADPAAGRVSVPLSLFVFDVLHLDGRDLLDEPGHLRRAALEATLPPEVLTPRLAVADTADPRQVERATSFAADTVARGHEGVVVKSDAAPYDMGRRGSGWVKVKPVHTLDLVILAVERGNGRRSGWLSNLHLGALDPTGRYGEPGGFVMLGKTFKGLTDEMLRWQTQELPRHAAGPTDGYVVRLHPEVVVEIAFDGVQTSPRYPAGVALRFARVVRHRTDKGPGEADTIEAVQSLRAP
jgi:DNA ligase-1